MKTLGLLLVLSLSNAALSHADEAPPQVEKAKAIYSCPMHPDVKSDHPGECPICHMKLQKISSPEQMAPSKSPTGAASKKIKFYRHPMNPSITSKVPAKDNMGMDYIPAYETEESNTGSLSDVPLRGVVTMDEAQFRLSGAALAKVERRTFSVTIPVAGRALSSARIALQVPERELGKLKPGMEVEVTSPATGQEAIQGKIAGLDSVLDPMTRTLRVDVQLLRPNPSLKSEASVQGVIRKKIQNVVAISRESLMQSGASAYVFVANREAGRFVPKKVAIGEKGEDWVEVQEGLTEGQLISSGPNFLIDSESRIQTSYEGGL